MVVCSQVPDQSSGYFTWAVGVSRPFRCCRPRHILHIVPGCDDHPLLLPSPRYLCLFVFSLAFLHGSMFGRLVMSRSPGMAGLDGSSQ